MISNLEFSTPKVYLKWGSFHRVSLYDSAMGLFDRLFSVSSNSKVAVKIKNMKKNWNIQI